MTQENNTTLIGMINRVLVVIIIVILRKPGL